MNDPSKLKFLANRFCRSFELINEFSIGEPIGRNAEKIDSNFGIEREYVKLN